ncbi:AMP-binding protein [Octadecabacter sp.]|nr:AMP-binding protein [Octadecabacter sp.]
MTNLTHYQHQFWTNLASNRDKTAMESAGHSITYGQIKSIIVALDEKFDREQHLTFIATRSIESAIFTVFALMTGRSFSPISNKVPKSTIEYYLSQTSSHDLIDPTKVMDVGTTNKSSLNTHEVIEKIKSNDDIEKIQYILFTSGSTGTPKGVPISFKNLQAYYDAAIKLISPTRDDIFSQTFDHSFDLAIHDILLSMSSFAKLIILNQDELRRPTYAISTYKITIWFSVPSLITFFEPSDKTNVFSNLRIAMFCGEKFFTEHAFYLRGLGIKNIQNWYGPTEATIACSCYQFRSNETKETLPIGTPFEGSEFYFYKDNHGQQLFIGGNQVFKDYTVGNPDAFENIDHKRYYKSGDLISISDDQTYIVGRNNSMAKINGYRVDLNEIENAASTITSNANIVALAVNNGSSIWLIVENFLNFTEREFLDQLAPLVPEYAQPKKIHIIPEFPRSIAGKIDRNALAKRIEDTIKANIAEKDLISQLNHNVKISNLGLDSLQTMRLLLQLETMTSRKLSFEQVEQFLNMTIREILLNKDNQRGIISRKPQFLTKSHVYTNSRCRRFSVIYHKHRKYISDDTKYIAIGSSGLFHALGMFQDHDTDIINFCTPGMSLDAIGKLCYKISSIDKKDIKIIFEIDPVMLTEERPKGDFALKNGYVPRPPLFKFGSSEYDYFDKENGFKVLQQNKNLNKMMWQERREVVIKTCYADTHMWTEGQLEKIRHAYLTLTKSFETVYTFIQPLRSEPDTENLQNLVASLLSDAIIDTSVQFLKLDHNSYEYADFQDINHFSVQGAARFKNDLKNSQDEHKNDK